MTLAVVSAPAAIWRRISTSHCLGERPRAMKEPCVGESVSLRTTMGVDAMTYKHVLNRFSFGTSALGDHFVTYSTQEKEKLADDSNATG